jgi:hypothetical protein
LKQNRKAACGKHREEILNQLRGMTKSEPYDPEEYISPANLSTDFERDIKADIVPSVEVKLLFHWLFSYCVIIPDSGFLVLRSFSIQPCIVYLCACINN